MEYLCTCARAHRASVPQERFDRLCSNLVSGLGVTKYVLSTIHGWGRASLHVRTCTPPPSPYFRIRLTNLAKIWCVARDPIVTRFTKVGGGVTAHSHVRLQFRWLANRSASTLKPHQKQTYLIRARSYIATHGVLLVCYVCYYVLYVFKYKKNVLPIKCSRITDVSGTRYEKHVRHIGHEHDKKKFNEPSIFLMKVEMT